MQFDVSAMSVVVKKVEDNEGEEKKRKKRRLIPWPCFRHFR
jgi:hypothetical protein